MKKLLFITITLLSLTSCKLSMIIPTPLSALTDNKVLMSSCIINVEIDSCYNRTTGQPSEELVKLQQKIPYIFEGAKFLECGKSSYFDSYASFTIPLVITGTQPPSDKYISIYSDEVFLAKVNIPDHIKRKIKLSNNAELFSKIREIEIELYVKNTYNTEQEFGIHNAYIGGKPEFYNEYILYPGGVAIVKLSNVSVSLLLEDSNDNNFYTGAVLSHIKP